MNIYNNEICHYGIPGMKWGKRKLKEIQEANKQYKIKIDKISKSKSAHKSDVEAAKIANQSTPKKVVGALTSAVVSTLIGDLMSGRIKNYGNLSSAELISKFGDIGKRATLNMAIDEITARSVANKYNTSGKRIKGSNKSLFTREEVAKASINAVIQTAPILKTVAYLKLSQMHRQRTAGEAAFNKWGGRILNDKLPDYSNIIPNANYTVK